METSSSRAMNALRRVESRMPPEADHTGARHSRLPHKEGGEGVHRLGRNHDGALRGARGDLRREAADETGVAGEQVLAPHARGADGARGHDHKAGALDVIQGFRTREGVAIAPNGRGLHDVEHFSARDARLDVHDMHVRDSLFRDEEGGVRPDVAPAHDAHPGHGHHLSAPKGRNANVRDDSAPAVAFFMPLLNSKIIYRKSRTQASMIARRKREFLHEYPLTAPGCVIILALPWRPPGPRRSSALPDFA